MNGPEGPFTRGEHPFRNGEGVSLPFTLTAEPGVKSLPFTGVLKLLGVCGVLGDLLGSFF